MAEITEREELVAKAKELNLEFAPNIGDKKLKQLISEAENLHSNDKVPSEKENDKPLSKRERIAIAKKKAFETRVVTITNKDVRESDVVTTAHLSFENDYFGLAKNVPLDVPVELELSLIEIAKKALMTLHKDEIVDGKRTGNKIPTRVSKYAVSYED